VAGQVVCLGVAALATLAAGGAEAPNPPVLAPLESVLKLDDSEYYVPGYAFRQQPEQRFPVGWVGRSEPQTGVSCQPLGVVQGKQAFLLHPPYRGGTGYTFQDYRLQIPADSEPSLEGFVAIHPNVAALSDGVVFRILTEGSPVWEFKATNAAWTPFKLDFSAWAGKEVQVRFLSDVGPRNDSAYDWALWGERQLVMSGNVVPPPQHPPAPALVLSNMWPQAAGGVAPRSAFSGVARANATANGATLAYEGADGRVEHTWEFPTNSAAPCLGTWVCRIQAPGGPLYELPLAGLGGFEWAKPARWHSAGRPLGGPAASCLLEWETEDGPCGVLVTADLQGKSLVLELSASTGALTAFEAGDWGPLYSRRLVTVPYYGGKVRYLPRQDVFVNAFLDWTWSGASEQASLRAAYLPKTDGSRNPLRERIVFAVAWHLAEVFPNNPNPPSPFRSHLAGRPVLDLWGGRFPHISAGLTDLGWWGLTNAVALVHIWQRDGYDNALPAHYPAMALMGGEEGLRAVGETARQMGFRLALHENYAEYFPNYEGFQADDVALLSTGERRPGWYNVFTGVRAFAAKPGRMRALAQGQSPEIHRRYRTSAAFLDELSAVLPWVQVDFDARVEGAASFAACREAYRDLFDYAREAHEGPVFGEGGNHWYTAGLVDGVEAEFRSGAGWPGNQGPDAPLMADFDLLRIHPLQVNHGMGYHQRWWNTAGWQPLPPMAVMDQYRLQEVAFGHSGFVSNLIWDQLPFPLRVKAWQAADAMTALWWTELPFTWLEARLLSGLGRRCGAAQPLGLEYRSAGSWVDGSTAAKAGVWEALRVTYEGGLTVLANQGDAELDAPGVTLPRLGWHASAPGFRAFTGKLGGAWVDYAEDTHEYFANARNSRDWRHPGCRPWGLQRLVPVPAESRTLAFFCAWAAASAPGPGEELLCHLETLPAKPAEADVVAEWSLPLATRSPAPGDTNAVLTGPHPCRLPEALPDGDYTLFLGLWDPQTGRRAFVEGADPQHRRLAARVNVRAAGTAITLTPVLPPPEADDGAFAQNLNLPDTLVDFGPLRTDGSVWLFREGSAWVVRTWPPACDFTLELNRRWFPAPATVNSPGGREASVQPVVQADWWRLPLNAAREYRWARPLPTLQATRAEPQGVRLSWPASAAETYVVEGSEDLREWVPLSPPVQTMAANLEWSVEVRPAANFFRLRIE
jgi:hypothetical protein